MPASELARFRKLSAPEDGSQQSAEWAIFSGGRGEVNPGVMEQELQMGYVIVTGTVAAGKQNRNDSKSRLAALSIDRELELPVLPAPETRWSQEDDACVARAQRVRQLGLEWLPLLNTSVIEKKIQASRAVGAARDLQSLLDPDDDLTVPEVVRQERIVLHDRRPVHGTLNRRAPRRPGYSSPPLERASHRGGAAESFVARRGRDESR